VNHYEGPGGRTPDEAGPSSSELAAQIRFLEDEVISASPQADRVAEARTDPRTASRRVGQPVTQLSARNEKLTENAA